MIRAHGDVLRRSGEFSLWKGELFATGADSKWEVGAVTVNCDQWHESDNEVCLTYGITQIPTGHGNFGEYRHRIGAKRTVKSIQRRCKLCAARTKIVKNSRQISRAIGNNLAPSVVVRALAAENLHRRAVIDFAKKRYNVCNEMERSMEKTILARQIRRRFMWQRCVAQVEPLLQAEKKRHPLEKWMPCSTHRNS